jgi:predicted dehydrogenase
MASQFQQASAPPYGSTVPIAVPADLDYEMWLGPAPMKPYTADRCTNLGAYHIYDYALGFIAGWGIHPLDIALWGGGDLLSSPVEIQGRGSFHMEGACDTATVWDIDLRFGSGVTIQYVGVPNGGNASRPTCDAWPQAEEWRQRYRRITSHGTAFEGTDGWVHVDREGIHLQPENLIDQKEEDLPVRLKKSSNHARDFLDSVRSRVDTVCPIDEAVRGDALCHLSDIAIRLNRKVTWDLARERFIGDEEANLRLRARNLRPPWHL